MSSTIKFKSNKEIKLNNTIYKPYLIGNLPKKFAYIYDENEDREGITQWFNYKGFTYIEKSNNPWE
jgi:hypothetical protein